MKSPIGRVKETFGDKAKLIAELETFSKDEALWVSRLNANKGLAHVSNAKLLRLHATFTAVKEKFGTRAKLIDAVAELEKRAKDEGFKARLGSYPVPRLYDMWKASSKRSGAAEKATAAKKAPAKKAAAKPAKAPAKKPAKKAAAGKKTTSKKA